jgi:hypothetical protein
LPPDEFEPRIWSGNRPRQSAEAPDTRQPDILNVSQVMNPEGDRGFDKRISDLMAGLNEREGSARPLDRKSGKPEHVEHQPAVRISRSRRRGNFRVSCL